MLISNRSMRNAYKLVEAIFNVFLSMHYHKTDLNPAKV